MKYLAYCLLLGLAWCLPSVGQNVSIQARLDRPEIKIGERAAIDLTIRTDDLSRTRFYLLQDSTGAPERYRVLSFGATDTIDIGKGVQEIKAQMIVTSFDSTLITLPPIVVETPSGQAMTKPLALNVISPEVDLSQPENIRPIVSPWDEPYTLMDILSLIFTSWIFYAVAGLLLIALLIYEYRNRAQYLQVVKPEILRPVSALEQLKRKLEALGDARLETQEDFKRYYSTVTDGLRAYLGARYGFEAMERTTDEVIEKLHSRGLGSEQTRHIEQVLMEASLVKFAKSLPERGDALQLRTQTLALAEGIERLFMPSEGESLAGKEVIQ
ncbi:hypothetical protein [Porphyromonas catoniae]|uniref:hypothetical protein n=1 Tax=Porphyromonas catoniae TaxID=41976 RepID=UPI0028D51324|nr:hypothetical protein [Porphyromonas catoniae]